MWLEVLLDLVAEGVDLVLEATLCDVVLGPAAEAADRLADLLRRATRRCCC